MSHHATREEVSAAPILEIVRQPIRMKKGRSRRDTISWLNVRMSDNFVGDHLVIRAVFAEKMIAGLPAKGTTS